MGLAFTIRGFGMTEDTEKLFTLREWCQDNLLIRSFGTGLAYRADNLAGLVNHSDRLAERRHRD